MSSKDSGNKRKKLKLSEKEAPSTSASSAEPKKDYSSIFKEIKEDRNLCAKSIEAFKFNKKRVRVLSETNDFDTSSNGVLYWMSRDQRVQDNWAFLYAQHLALKMESPLYVCFCLVPKFLDATIRHYRFMLKGLQEVAEECESLNISFSLLTGEAKDVIPPYIKKHKIGGIVTDFSPLRVPLKWVNNLKIEIPENIAFCQVDAHNIVPCWAATDKLEYAARTIRKKIHDKLNEFQTDFPPVVKHKYPATTTCKKINWNKVEDSLEVNMEVVNVDWAVPGTKAGLLELSKFCDERLQFFHNLRNNPTKDALSNLSPWIHFGQISMQRCILKALKYKKKYPESVNAYCEEGIVRKELADNFCFYNPKYDQIEGAYEWAQKTLQEHANDKREHLYTKAQLEHSQTYDQLWNAAQKQMVVEGKMHGFLRMYWAKKILEWTASPKKALEIAIYLNDKYELDGRDPNGYVGCMWSICGVHDQGWKERDVFGKIRYMNYKGCERKFDVQEFISKYQ